MTEIIKVEDEEFEVEVLRKVEYSISESLFNLLDEHVGVKFDKYGYADLFGTSNIDNALEEVEDELIVEEYGLDEEDKKDLIKIKKLFTEHNINLVTLVRC